MKRPIMKFLMLLSMWGVCVILTYQKGYDRGVINRSFLEYYQYGYRQGALDHANGVAIVDSFSVVQVKVTKKDKE